MSDIVKAIEAEIKRKEQDIVRQEDKIVRIKLKHDKQTRKERTHRLILRGVTLENAMLKIVGDREVVERLGNEHIEKVLDTALSKNEVQKQLEQFAQEL